MPTVSLGFPNGFLTSGLIGCPREMSGFYWRIPVFSEVESPRVESRPPGCKLGWGNQPNGHKSAAAAPPEKPPVQPPRKDGNMVATLTYNTGYFQAKQCCQHDETEVSCIHSKFWRKYFQPFVFCHTLPSIAEAEGTLPKISYLTRLNITVPLMKLKTYLL